MHGVFINPVDAPLKPLATICAGLKERGTKRKEIEKLKAGVSTLDVITEASPRVVMPQDVDTFHFYVGYCFINA